MSDISDIERLCHVQGALNAMSNMALFSNDANLTVFAEFVDGLGDDVQTVIDHMRKTGYYHMLADMEQRAAKSQNV